MRDHSAGSASHRCVSNRPGGVVAPVSRTGQSARVDEAMTRAPMPCRCEELKRLDGEEAEAYARHHLTLIERGRANFEMYQCVQTETSWIMDFPLGHWATNRRGRVRLRREPFDEVSLPVGALDL